MLILFMKKKQAVLYEKVTNKNYLLLVIPDP